MKKSRYRWILTLLRLALCAFAVYFLYRTVNLHDRIKLRDQTKVRVIEDHDTELLILRDGKRETIDADQVFVDEQGQRAPVEPGLKSVVRDVNAAGALLALLIFFPATLLQALRLVWMLAIQNIKLTYWNAIKMSYAGNFFNFALPGTTGGDLIKAYYITRFTQHKTEAVTTVFLDRVVGLLGLVALAGTMIAVTWDSETYGNLAVGLAAIGVALVIGIVVVFSSRVRAALRLSELAARLPAGEQLLRIGRATVAMRQHKTLVFLSLMNTVALQLTVMISGYFMAMALGMHGHIFQYLIYVPIGFLISAVPIAPPQGFGVMESFFVLFFVKNGLSTASQAVTFALALRLIQLTWALPGVLVPLLGAHLPSKTELAQMESAGDADERDASQSGGETASDEP